AIASGYEEFGPIWQHDRELIIKAMRAYASDHAPTVNGCDDASEPTQEEIEGVACVFADVHDDPTARASAYIMTKKLKRVFAAPTVRPADAGERIHALAIDLTLKGWCANENEINRLTKEAERKLLDFACDEIRRHMDRTGVSLGGGLLDAAQAVIDRWETPAWKDAPATAGYINALKTAVQRSAASSDNAPTSATHASEWTPEIDKRVLLYVVHDQAQWEPDEELRMRNWEGWHVGYWTDFNGGGWVWNGLCGHVTHVAPLLAPPSDPRNDRQTGVPQS
uniref:hypothetical protein n=1 Tax=Tardiphaga sp. TaxID=1926292 RepID=UPI0037D9F100